MRNLNTFLIILGFTIGSNHVHGQGSITANEIAGGDRLNTITTAVPFLLIAPDSRAGAMGDAGVATAPDANSMHWNASKLAFIEEKSGFSLSYTPWLRNLVPDISLSYMSGFYKMSEVITLGMAIKYFSLGDIQFTDEFGNDLRTFNPNEFSIDGAVAAKLSKDFSGSFTLKYIHSNLTGGIAVQGSSTKPGQMVAADLGVYYRNNRIKVGDRKSEIAAGLSISNIGGKISYSNTQKKDFLPINLRLGPRFTYNVDDYNKISVHVDFNKLMVPTPPIYKTDAAGQPILDGDNFVIGAGKDPDRPVVEGMFTSFNDAPGNPLRDDKGNYIEENDVYKVEDGSVFKEEMREISWGAGLEYWYDDLFAIRTGYFWEHELKGNRKYFNLGAGFRYNVFGLDFSYLIPAYFGKSAQQSPLQNTLRFTLLLNFAQNSANKSGNSSGTQGVNTGN
ncbi:MAG: type IX secretion system outer membrane channel protein PorV [Flavobacteriales bacterium]|nr:type IX secretion system outer membrane channel protein PorV [Flavobacteriales bacterium]